MPKATNIVRGVDSDFEPIIKSFEYKGSKYIWHEDDMVYYHEDTDDNWFSEVPM